MRPVDIHREWAQNQGTWSPWVKPVLFASIEQDEPAQGVPRAPEWIGPEIIEPLSDSLADPYRAPGGLRDSAIVIDLPGDEGTKLGVALAEHGFRPIPLYNAVPSPIGIIDLRAVVAVIARSAEHVAKVSPAAPPAFLLDATRMGRGLTAQPGWFDNRSICRASDFPSSETLRKAGIRRILVIGEALEDDLEPILLEWQAAGLAIWWKRPSERQAAGPLTVRAPWIGRRLWNRVVQFAIRPRADGAYGRMIEEPSAG